MTKLHTPGPYILWGDGRTIGIESIDLDENDETYPIACWEVVDYGDMADPEQLEADQEFAYRAITSHYPLLAQLEKAEAFISGFEDDEMQDGINDTLAEIRAAIKMAKGQ